MFQAGFGKRCISPPIGAPLAGFAAREGVSTGVHDDLYARAIVLDNGETKAALISVDVLGLSSQFTDRTRAGITRRTGIDPSAILIASTHTHAGPVTILTFFNPEGSLDPVYMDRLATAIEESAEEAWRNRFPARVGVGSGRIKDLGVNRRTADQRPIDDEIGIVRVDDANGQARAVMVEYSCHPTILGPNNLLVSGDFPAATIDRIESALGAGSLAMFVNGTQGNISVGHSSELSAIGVITPGRTFERAAELGGRLADAALRALPEVRTTGTPTLGAMSVSIDLPLKQYPPAAETDADLRRARERVEEMNGSVPAELRKAKSDLLYASITDFYAREAAKFSDGRLPIEMQGVRINDALFAAVPGEVFVEIGLRAKKAAPRPTFIVGIANGYVGYLPERAAYTAGGYEVVSAKVGPDSEDRLLEGVAKLESGLFSSK